jgi:hypothetical protein
MKRSPFSPAYQRVRNGQWCAAFLAGTSIQQIACWAVVSKGEVEAAIRRGLKRRARGRG